MELTYNPRDMEQCVFCQIVTGEIPCRKVWENEDFLAFLDIRPLTRGNCLVIPKKHYRWVDEVPNFGEYFEVAKKVGLAAKTALGAEWVSYITIGREIPHAHIRVIPRYKQDLHGDLVSMDRIEILTDTELDEITKKMREGAI